MTDWDLLLTDARIATMRDGDPDYGTIEHAALAIVGENIAWLGPTAELPEGTAAADALDRVLRLPSVCSKRFLTTKVDRSVTGLVAQQQCVGPLQTPLADCAVVAHSHVTPDGSPVQVWVVPTDEEMIIATDALRLARASAR